MNWRTRELTRHKIEAACLQLIEPFREPIVPYLCGLYLLCCVLALFGGGPVLLVASLVGVPVGVFYGFVLYDCWHDHPLTVVERRRQEWEARYLLRASWLSSDAPPMITAQAITAETINAEAITARTITARRMGGMAE